MSSSKVSCGQDFGIGGPFVATCLAHLVGAILLSAFVEEAKQHSDEDIPKGTSDDDEDWQMEMSGIGGMAGFWSLKVLKWQRCGTETSSDTATIAYVVCLKEQFYSVLTSLYKWVSYLFSFSLSLMESRCGNLDLYGSPRSASLSSVDHPGYLVNLLEGQAWEVLVSAMAKVVVLGCIVTCIVLVSCRSLISFWCPSATWWAKHASPSLFLFYWTTASAIHPKAQEKWLPSVFGPRPSGVGWCFLMHLWGIGIFLTVTSIIVLTNQAFIESVLLWPDWSSGQAWYLWPWQSSIDKW